MPQALPQIDAALWTRLGKRTLIPIHIDSSGVCVRMRWRFPGNRRRAEQKGECE